AAAPVRRGRLQSRRARSGRIIGLKGGRTKGDKIMAKSQIEASAPRKPLSTLNGLRAVVFGSSLLGFLVLTFGGGLIGNAVAFSIPYMLAAMVLSNYLVRDLFGIGAG